MNIALKEALIEYNEDEIPIGAIIVHKDKIISRGYNQSQKLKDSTAHAEMIAITSAQNKIGSKYLNECELYVTLEPCAMCGGALYWSQLSKVVYGAKDEKRGYRSQKVVLHPKTKVVGGVMEAEAGNLLKRFFIEKRNLN